MVASSVHLSIRGARRSRLWQENSVCRRAVDPGLHSGYTDEIEGETGRTAREGLP
jgi:hypothetical protein